MSGTFHYVDWRNRPARLNVRDCPNPAVVRAMLEDLLERPVRWEARRG